MELEEIYTKFLTLEERLDLFNVQIDGVKYWERVRANIFLTLFEKIAGSGSITPASDTKQKKMKRFIASIFRLGRNPFLSKKKDVLIVGSPRRILQSDGCWWDIYTDPIIEKFDFSYVSVENQYLQNHAKPAKTPNLKYMDFLDFRAYVKQKRPFGSFSISTEERAHLLLVKKEIEQIFQTKINIEAITVAVLKKRKAALPLYMKLLRKIQPKIVVVVVGYGKEDLVEACRLLKIPIIELQHGVISPYHPGYSYPSREKMFFPDYLLTFGDYWLEAANYPLDEDRILSVGYPYLESEMEKYRSVEKKKQIVIISQERIGLQLSKFGVALSEMKKFDHRIIYKLHPREIAHWRESYPWLVDADLEVIDEPGISLYELFAQSSIQIGVFSTAIYEGLAFGLQTFLVDLPGVEYFDQLIKKQVVTKVNSAEDFLEKFELQSKVASFESEHFFKSNAIEAIIQELKRIMNSDA